MEQKKVGTGTKVLYGLGAFGYGSIGQTLGSFLMFFGTGILGIPGALMGLAVAIGTVWDATTDPFVGYYSDKMRSRVFGKRHAFILFGCIFVAITNILIWSISPGMSIGSKFAFMLILLLVIETFNTIYSTPYQALGLDLSKTYEDRTAVQAYKTTFSFLSLLVPSFLMMVFLSPGRYATMDASARGYIEIAWFTSALCILTGLVTFFGTYKHRHKDEEFIKEPKLSRQQKKLLRQQEKKSGKGIFADFFGVVKQKNVTRLIIGYAISLGAGAFITSLGLHIFTYTFQFSTFQIPIIMLCLVFGIIAGQPLWFWYSKKTDKISALLTAICVVIIGILIFSIALAFRNTVHESMVLPFVAITIFICGIGTGCLYSLPISMFADCIEIERQKTGVDKTAISAGFLTFCTKISNAFIMFVIGVSLDLIGFRGGEPTQSLDVQNWLGWLLIIGVILACTSALFVYSGYTYSKKDFEESMDPSPIP
ncbi:MAG: MFS transporter [Firmicutes bacterium]|nr:MFS transporter [Bacillota bacterium]